MAAQAIYRAVMQRDLSRTMGIAWTPADEYGHREIAGMPGEAIRHYSKRRQQIEHGLAERAEQGLSTGTAAADLIAHRTRRGKEHGVAEATLRERWAADLDANVPPEVATQVRAVASAAHRALGQPRRQLTVSAGDAAGAFDALAGPAGLTEYASSFTRQEVLVALGGQRETANVAELEAFTDRFLAERAIPLAAGEPARAGGRVERRWSRPELLAAEQRLVEAAVTRAGEGRVIVPPAVMAEAVDRSARAGVRLGSDQTAMVRGVLSDGQGVSVVIGRAGTGKTTAADAARYGFEAAGYELLGLAPTGTAARLLNRDTGIPTQTLDRFLLDSGAGAGRTDLNGQTVVLVDEAGMIGTRKLLPLLERAHRAGTKVVLIGDDKQLQSIDAGGGFRAITHRLGAYELTVNRRQRDPLDQEAVELIRQGRGDEAMRLYHDRGRVHVAETLADCDRATVDDWWQAYHHDRVNAGMFDHRRVDVDRLNDLARQRMAAAGRLGPDALLVGDREFRVGDWVVCGRNTNPARDGLDVTNGTRGYVTSLDAHKGTVTIRTDEGEHTRDVVLPRSYLTRRLERRRVLDHSYATTGHKTQGATYERGFARAGVHCDQEWTYTVATRPKQRMDFYMVGHARELDAAAEVDVPPGPRELPNDPIYEPAAAVAASVVTSNAHTLALEDRQLGDDVRNLSTRALRDEAARLERDTLRSRPRSRVVTARNATERRQAAEAEVHAAREQLAAVKRELAAARSRFGQRAERRQLEQRRQRLVAGVQLADRRLANAADQERLTSAHERQRAVWEQAHRGELRRHGGVRRELAWRHRAVGRAAEGEMPGYLVDFLGPRPDSVRGARRWRQLAAGVHAYREQYEVTDPVRALGAEPKTAELPQRQTWRTLRRDAERLWSGQRTTGARDKTTGHLAEIARRLRGAGRDRAAG